MNTREEVIRAFADYQAGRLGSIPAVTAVHNTPTTIVEWAGGRPGRSAPSGPDDPFVARGHGHQAG